MQVTKGTWHMRKQCVPGMANTEVTVALLPGSFLLPHMRAWEQCYCHFSIGHAQKERSSIEK